MSRYINFGGSGGNSDMNVVASGIETWTVGSGDHEFTIYFNGVDVPAKDLITIAKIHERLDNSNESGGGDAWAITDTWFIRNDNAKDVNLPPDGVKIRIHRVIGGSGGYDVTLNWYIIKV